MILKNLRVGVTGGAGFIGSHLVDQLIHLKNHVVVFDNFSTGTDANLAHHAGSSHLTIVRGDVRGGSELGTAFKGCDVVFHLATHCVRLSLTDPGTNHEVNATGTMNALTAAKRAGVKLFVYCSSSEVFGNGPTGKVSKEIWLSEDSPKEPCTVYGASKLVGEHYTLAFHHIHGLKTVVARPFNAFGPRSHIQGPYGEVIPRFAILTHAGRAPLIFGDGSQTRDFTYVEDTAAGLIAAAQCEALLGSSVNIAAGQSVSVRQLAEILCELNEAKCKPVYLPPRPGDVQHLRADTHKADALLAQAGKTEFREGLKRYLSWLKNTGVDFSELARGLAGENWKEVA